MQLYSDLAPWFHLLTAPADYAEEAAEHARLIHEICPDGRTLLELGSGGGNNASHLKRQFTCTLTDLSPDMLDLSREINPECEHLQGDMRTLRLGRTFDAVFVHDAICYLLTESDLAAAMATAFEHTRPGGVALFIPDCRTETFHAGTDTGGHDSKDGRALRYLEWTTDPDPNDTTYLTDYAILMRDAKGNVRVVHDRHTCGVFPDATWFRLLHDAGFEATLETLKGEWSTTDEWAAFVARRPAAR